MIGKLESVIAASVGPLEFEDLKTCLFFVEAEKELERHKARHFRLQVAAVAKQAL